MRVGKFFNLAEFGNAPAAATPGIGALCALFLDPLREEFGPCTITSAFRSKSHNAKVGGASESRHVYTERPLEVAVDCRFARGTPAAWGRRARALAARHGRGGVGTYDTHVHVDVGPRRIWG